MTEWREVELGLGERVKEKDCWRLVEDHKPIVVWAATTLAVQGGL
jgi:hypothetical protein